MYVWKCHNEPPYFEQLIYANKIKVKGKTPEKNREITQELQP
jgi:hypothetical protein